MSERLVVTRPDWLTDEEVEEVARRTAAALAEAGWPCDYRPAPDERVGFYFKSAHVPAEVYDRARLLAFSSLGIVPPEWLRSGGTSQGDSHG